MIATSSAGNSSIAVYANPQAQFMLNSFWSLSLEKVKINIKADKK